RSRQSVRWRSSVRQRQMDSPECPIPDGFLHQRHGRAHRRSQRRMERQRIVGNVWRPPAPAYRRRRGGDSLCPPISATPESAGKRELVGGFRLCTRNRISHKRHKIHKKFLCFLCLLWLIRFLVQSPTVGAIELALGSFCRPPHCPPSSPSALW